MSAKVSIIIYIVICLEVGVLLAILPWTDLWTENYFLAFLGNKLKAGWLVNVITSGYFKGAISALGAINILAGLHDIFTFRSSVNSMSSWENSVSDSK